MKILRASKMGFCFGVEKAIEIVNNTIKENKNSKKNIYVLGMLVHNEKVISDFQNKGVIFTDEKHIEDIEEESIVIVRAHGTTRENYERLSKKNIKICDGACIFVKKLRNIIEKKSKQDYKILVMGDKLHPEIKGIVSYGKEIEIYENLDLFRKEFKNIFNKYYMIFQTTYNNEEYNAICNYVKNNIDNIEIEKTICGATYERQKSAKELASKVDIMFVVGGKNSSNTKKIYDISKSINHKSYLLSDVSEIDLKKIDKMDIIGITAGASTPKESIEEIVKKIKSIKFEEEK